MLLVAVLLPMVACPVAPLVALAVVVLLVDHLAVLVALGVLLVAFEVVVALLRCFLQWGLILAFQRV